MSDDVPVSPISGKPFPKSQAYDGGCHCGKVSFTVKLSPPLPEMVVTQCDCSICHTNGHLMVYPLESQITWHSGRDELVPYTFGPTRITHSFCPVCGTSICGKSNDPNFFANNRAMNVRTLRGVDLDELVLRKISMRDTIPPQGKDLSYDPSKHPSNPFGTRVI